MVVQLEWLMDPGWPYLRQMPDDALKEQATRKFDNKSHTWIPDPADGFVIGEIIVAEGSTLTVKLPNGSTKKTTKDQCQEINPAKFEKAEDMSNLSILNEASVLHNLYQRYKSMMIYTYSGLFCVFINPYKMLPIYTESVINMYVNQRRNEVPPHLFAVSDEAYRNMIADKQNQSMLITGESGAGKTENTKKVISYFAKIGAKNDGKQNELKKSVSFSDFPPGGSLEDKVVQANPVLEALGNAKTVRNNNSSRFGKFIRIHFDSQGKLVGGDIEHYLLEKSRIINQGPGERSFHIFYQIMSSKKLRKELLLSNDIKDYHFVSMAEVTVPGMNDSDELKITSDAFSVMGFTALERNDIYRLCASIMHMSQLKFKQKPREEQAEVDSMMPIDNVCKLFSINGEKLIQSILSPKIRVGTELVIKGQTMQQADWSVQGLAKGIYARMFSWLIKRCNETLSTNLDESKNYIGVLDIAGFEIFDTNSFEQLWINFVNEKLQQFFNHHMFILEQEEYQREGIAWEFIDFGLDLQNCIDLIEKPLGLISILNEECLVPKASDITYVEKLKNQHLGKHSNFVTAKPPKGKQGEAHYAIIHYAGTVRYNVTAWLEKNKDPLNESAVAVLKTSPKENLIYKIFEDYTTEADREDAAQRGVKGVNGKKKGKSSSFMTVSDMYKESLNNLMTMLHTTHPHFIRCIIPNEVKQSGLIDAPLVLNQLTCNGVLEGIRICRKGFPNRLIFKEFIHRYAVLAPNEARLPDLKEATTKMMALLLKSKKVKEEEYKIGETKIFFKSSILARLEEYRDIALSAIILKFQSALRAYLAKVEYYQRLKQSASIADLQRNVKSWIQVGNWNWYKLYVKLKPMMGGIRTQQEMDTLQSKVKEMESKLAESAANYDKLMLDKDLGSKREQALKENVESEKKEREKYERKIGDLENLLEDEKKNFEDKLRKASQSENQMTSDRKRMEEDIFQLRQELESKTMKSTIEVEELTQRLLLQGDITDQANQKNKAQESAKLDLMDQLEMLATKLERVEKQKSQCQEELELCEDKLMAERRNKEEQTKLRKKAETEFKNGQEQIMYLNEKLITLEKDIKLKHDDLARVRDNSFSDSGLISKMQINIRQLIERIGQIEEELDQEQRAKQRLEKGKHELQGLLDDANQTITELNGQLNAQLHINKSKQTEIAEMYREIEKKNINHESHLADMCSMHVATLNNLRVLSKQAKHLEYDANVLMGHRNKPPLPKYTQIIHDEEDQI
uniref:Myosin head n=1 Tax=Rhabditophanes sp. KR3021 TaxID=114890 RepID=A0AC35UA49_9BILA